MPNVGVESALLGVVWPIEARAAERDALGLAPWPPSRNPGNWRTGSTRRRPRVGVMNQYNTPRDVVRSLYWHRACHRLQHMLAPAG